MHDEEEKGVAGMSKAIGFIVLAVCLLGSMPVLAAEREGSLPQELAAKQPPPPNEIYVAVFPFWSRDDRQTEVGRACSMLNLMRHGFRMAPKGSSSLGMVARRTDTALRRDPECEPLARLQPEDIARVGKALGAQWAVYGEFGDLHTESEKDGILRHKAGVLDLRFQLIEVASGDVLYWSRIRDTASSGGGLWAPRATSIERKLVTRAINSIFDDIGTALPDHYAGAEVTSEEVRQLLEVLEK